MPGWSIQAVENFPMAVQMICPNLRCKKFLSVGDEHRGKLVRCQACSTDFRVPEVRRPAPPVVAAANTPAGAPKVQKAA
jgi:hypothetical protein